MRVNQEQSHLYSHQTFCVCVCVCVCVVVEELILKSVWKYKGPKAIRTIFKKNNCGRPTLPEVKTYYKFLLITSQKGKKMRNKIESPERDSKIFHRFIYKKRNHYNSVGERMVGSIGSC